MTKPFVPSLNHPQEHSSNPSVLARNRSDRDAIIIPRETHSDTASGKFKVYEPRGPVKDTTETYNKAMNEMICEWVS